MNGRMNHFPCVPPPTLCLQFPALQACTEGLPLMLPRPDSFPRVMGILQEINQEKVGFSRCTADAQRPLSVSEVKQESADVQEHHQSLNSEFCQEWSLKGVEELLTEPEDLHLQDDCFLQAQDLEACASDEKPLIGLRFCHSHYDQNALQEAQPPFDEKPLIHPEMASSLQEKLLFQVNAQHVDEKPKKTEVLLAALMQSDVNSKDRHAVPASFQASVEDRLGLHNKQAVKREPDEMEAEAHTCNERATPFGKRKGSNDCIAHWSADRKTLNRLSLSNEVTLSGDKSQSARAQPSEPELKLGEEKRRCSTHDWQRNTNAALALPADVSELEKSDPGKGYAHLSPSTSMSSASEGTMNPSVTCEKGQILAGDGKPQSVNSMAEPDCCELTLGLTSSKPNPGCMSLHCSEDKPVVEHFIGQEKHDGECQNTSPHQWRRARKRCVSREYYSRFEEDTVPECLQKQLFPARTDGCTSLSDKDVENPMEQMSNDKDHHKVFVEPQNFISKPEAGHCRASNNSRLGETGSKKTLQLMPQRIGEGGLPLEQEEIQENTSENLSADDSQVTEPYSPVATESSQPPQAEVAPLPSEPQKKRMRGTLPLDEKEAGISKEMDTRCHRSDGKSWRCVRECINGAYYCQYHLRKRRIGYNRRKNNVVNPDDLKAVNQESLKSNKKTQ